VTTKNDLKVGAGKGADAAFYHDNLARVRRDGLVDLIVDKPAAAPFSVVKLRLRRLISG
jgi:hypothetical protein